jgi:hypothetical protein
VHKLLGEDCLKILTQLIRNICGTGEWSKDFIEVTVIALKKKLKTATCSDPHTISPIAHSPKRAGEVLQEYSKMYLKKIGLSLEQETELGVQLGY